MVRFPSLFGFFKNDRTRSRVGSQDQPIFSKDEILYLMKALPYNPEDPSEPFEGGLYGAAGTHLYSKEFILRRLQEYLDTLDTPFSLRDLSKYLDVSPEDAKKLLDSRVVQSTKEDVLFPPLYLDQLTAELISSASQQFVSAETFCTLKDLPFSWILGHPKICRDGMLKDGDDSLVLKSWLNSKMYTNAYVFAHRVFMTLQNEIEHKIKQGIASNSAVEFVSPMDSDTFLAITTNVASAFSGVVKQTCRSSGLITFTPNSLLEDRAQSLMAKIETAQIPYMEQKKFYAQCRDLFPTKADRSVYEGKLHEFGRCSIFSSYFVSNLWLESEAQAFESSYDKCGFVDIASAFSTVPSPLRTHLLDWLVSRISSPRKPLRIVDCLVNKSLVQKVTDAALISVTEQANQNWATMISLSSDSSPKRLALQQRSVISALVAQFGFPNSVADYLYARISSSMNQRYLEALDALAARQKLEFASLWRERVLNRWVLYSSAIEMLPAEAPKELVPELQDVLTEHMNQLIEEVIVVAKADKVLPLSSQYRGAVLQLQSTLELANFDLLKTALSTFASDLEIETNVSKEALATAKKESMANILQSLHISDDEAESQELSLWQRDARLILAVLTILLARLPGWETSLLYATGRSVGRLAKALRIAVEGPGAVSTKGGNKKSKKGGNKKKKESVAETEPVESSGVVAGVPESTSESDRPNAGDLASTSSVGESPLDLVDRAIKVARKQEPLEESIRTKLLKLVLAE